VSYTQRRHHGGICARARACARAFARESKHLTEIHAVITRCAVASHLVARRVVMNAVAASSRVHAFARARAPSQVEQQPGGVRTHACVKIHDSTATDVSARRRQLRAQLELIVSVAVVVIVLHAAAALLGRRAVSLEHWPHFHVLELSQPLLKLLL